MINISWYFGRKLIGWSERKIKSYCSSAFSIMFQREFKCVNDSFCLSLIYYCDGEANCRDGSDEAKCDSHTHPCHSGEFACRDGTCLNKEYRCNGLKDCSDGSDEANCCKYYYHQIWKGFSVMKFPSVCLVFDLET